MPRGDGKPVGDAAPGTDNFALKNSKGIQFNYTAGAFHYGMFDTGGFMDETNGWFYNPAFNDYYNGGALNGRCTWGLGIAMQQEPQGPLMPALKQALQLSLKFCRRDALKPGYGYAFKTAKGNVYWRDAGEHAYLLIGMLAACSVTPELPVAYGSGTTTMTLRQACHASLNALVDLAQPGHLWSNYPNVDSMAIVALADGAALLADDPDAAQWVLTARNVADGWLAARVDPAQFPGEVIHFGLHPTATTMTYTWIDHNFIFFYQSGHWIQALARLYSVTKDERYRQRADAMITYLCGRNPWGLRLLSEIGGVYNMGGRSQWRRDRRKFKERPLSRINRFLPDRHHVLFEKPDSSRWHIGVRPVVLGCQLREPTGRPVRLEQYYDEARKIMERQGIMIDDLYGAVKPHFDTVIGPDGLHYKPEGYAIMAQQLTARIKIALETHPPSPIRSKRRG